MSSLHYRKKHLKDFSKTTGLVKPGSACFVTNDCEWIFCDAPCKTSVSASFKIVSFHLGVHVMCKLRFLAFRTNTLLQIL